MYQEIYYVAYFGLCAALVAWLARMLRRTGSVFLRDGFRERPQAVLAVGHLLETGLYLIGGGYLAITLPNYTPMNSPGVVVLTIVGKLGGFLLLLGLLHFVNLLILVIFRQRSLRVARAGELS